MIDMTAEIGVAIAIEIGIRIEIGAEIAMILENAAPALIETEFSDISR